MFYIYLTTNLINGKQYIGQHKGSINDNYLGSGTLILKAIQKYGKENFSKDILQICKTREEADWWEKFYINYFNAVESDNFYNLQEGGTKGDGWRSCDRWMKQHPEEAKKIYQKNYENLLKWRKNYPQEAYEKTIIPLVNGAKKWREDYPEEFQNNIKKLNAGKEKWQKEYPEQYKRQVEQWQKLGSIVNSQKVICLTTQEIFESQSEAARFYNIPQGNISKCLKGERKSAGKHPKTKEKLFWALYK